MQYLVFNTRGEADRVLDVLNAFWKQKGGGAWGNVAEHPVDLKFAVPYAPELSGAFLSGVLPGRLIEEASAYAEGFYLGPLNGRFYPAINKCQEAEFLLEALAGVYTKAPFPIARSLFLGVLGSLYAAECQLDAVVNGAAAKVLPKHAALLSWWKARLDEIRRKDGILKYLHVLYNTDKHGEPRIAGLKPVGRFLNEGAELRATGGQYMADALGTRLSAEGVFRSEPFVAGYERWHPHPDIDWVTQSGFKGAEFTFELLGLPETHLGTPFQQKDPVNVLRATVKHHWSLVGRAIEEWESASV